MLEVSEALTILLDAVSPLLPVERPFGEALGLTLAENVTADRDFPPTDRSAMDGFAVRAGDCTAPGITLTVVGEVRAGQGAEGVAVGAGEAVRIFTGGVIPSGADAVVMVEQTMEDRNAATVLVKERPESGQHIRRRGEDLEAGEIVRAAGSIVRAAEIAALASVGRTRVRVVRRAKVAVLSTGDEIIEVGAAPALHQVRNSNAWMLLAQLRRLGIEARHLGIARDDEPTLDAKIADGLGADVLIVTGGVSMGEYDLVGAALTRAGAEVLFHNVAMRPGKPILAARRESCLVLGLPGNPVSAFTGFHVFVRPALRKLMGDPDPIATPIRAVLLTALARRPGRLTYLLAELHWRDGLPVIAPVASSSSGDVLSLVRANAFIVVPGNGAALPAGTTVDVLPWND